jgi:hypothetical protein
MGHYVMYDYGREMEIPDDFPIENYSLEAIGTGVCYVVTTDEMTDCMIKQLPDETQKDVANGKHYYCVIVWA